MASAAEQLASNLNFAAFAKAVEGLSPRRPPNPAPAMRLSGLEPFTLAS